MRKGGRDYKTASEKAKARLADMRRWGPKGGKPGPKDPETAITSVDN